jgi:peptidoglycan biosynthesis protein MviN/MurJ (putative lipid II flippase)
MKDMRTPTVTSAWSVAINVGLNLAFVLGTPLQESGIALASAISNGWQTWALAKAVRNKLNASPDGHSGAAAREEVAKYMKLLAGAVIGSAVAGLIAYKIFVSKKDWTGYLAILNEGFIAFFAAILASLILLSFIMRGYFDKKLKDAPVEKDIGSYRYGRKEEHWSDALRFQFSLYATIMSSAVMGFVVWATRDSLPPEGGLIAVLQRALAPVVVGLIAYYFATSGMHSPDYQELLNVLRRKKKSRGAEQPKP